VREVLRRSLALSYSALKQAKWNGEIRLNGEPVHADVRVKAGDELTVLLPEPRPAYALRPFELPGASGPEGMLTCYPHRLRGEGQFAVLLVRAGEGTASLPANTSLPTPSRAQRELLRAFVPDAPEADAVFGETLVALPHLPELKGLRVLRAGLHLGQVKGKLFVPDHAWAVSATPPACPRIALTEEQARIYQAGDVLRLPDLGLKGYVLPCLEGLPLGFGKASDGQIKNHYPKGLRRP
jgi:NOL1/NOP2/fmu family ribosome biogenesis protein